jgi:hypothetical protein
MFETDANVWNYVIGAYAVSWLGMLSYALRLYILNRRATATAVELGGDS